MITAIVLLKAQVHCIPETGQALAELSAVSEVYSVAGPWDLVAIVRVRTQEELADTITHKIDKIPGITASETLFGLQVFSRHDLDRLFSLGFEGSGDPRPGDPRQ
ncbi:MAG: Lrp/AsnC ligand binding domain-containing protein [Actinomycetota bacterium]